MISLLVQRLSLELTNGNEGRTKTYFKSHSEKKKFLSYLAAKKLNRQPFDQPVVVHVTRILGKGQRLWDTSSGLRGNYKELEDALVDMGWFHDDSPLWITETRFFQCDAHREKGPAILLEVFPTEQSNQQAA